VSADVTLKIATPEDAARVAALLAASYPPLMAAGYDAALLAAALPLLTRANPALLLAGTFYLAEASGGRLVGCGGWTRERPDDGEVVPGVAHLRHFATHPERLRRGIGGALYRRCESDARSAGVRRFECYASLNSERFYAALGFASQRRVALALRPGLQLPAVLMARTI